MSDRPILFSGPMVRALLAGTKTQTRRVIRPRRHASIFDGSWADEYVLDPGNADWRAAELPYAVGDRLWVRENFAVSPTSAWALPKTVSPDPDMPAYYQADFDRSGRPRWKPSIHMPRWASRITLTVTEVRVQRLQEISRDDCIAEGIDRVGGGVLRWENWSTGVEGMHGMSPQAAYALLWNHINGPGSWDSNPWIAAYSFSVDLKNIDQEGCHE